MKNSYTLKMFLSASILSSASAFAQTLDEALCNLNVDYTNITDLVPNSFNFAYDGGANNINDGGNDMYDGANYINTNVLSNINYSDDLITASTAFGPGGAYFTRHLPGLFVMAADIDGITSFSISGNVGADGGGSIDGHTFNVTAGGQTYNAFVKRIYNAGDPSVNHVMLVPENVAVSHTYPINTNDDSHTLSDLSASTRLYYFLVSSGSGGYIDNTTIESIALEFLNVIIGGPAIVATASGTDLCYGDELTLTGSGGSGGFNWDNGVVDGVPFVPSVGTVTYHLNSDLGVGCNQIDSVTVVVKVAPEIVVDGYDEIGGNDGGAVIIFTAGEFPMTYDWDNDGTGDFDDDQNLTNLSAGTYNVVVMQTNGCSATGSVTINSQVGIEENMIDMTIYPNPTSADLVVNVAGQFNFQITDVSGRIVQTGNGQGMITISVNDLQNGTYFLTVQNEIGRTTQSFLKN